MSELEDLRRMRRKASDAVEAFEFAVQAVRRAEASSRDLLSGSEQETLSIAGGIVLSLSTSLEMRRQELDTKFRALAKQSRGR